MKAWKTLFIWLLMSFIPVQAVAVNTLLTCKAVQPTGLQHRMHSAAAHVRHHPHAAHTPADHEATRHESAHDDQTDASTQCPAHYAGIPWVPACKVTMPAVENSSAPIAYIAFHVPLVDPDPPEHPPRRFSF